VATAEEEATSAEAVITFEICKYTQRINLIVDILKESERSRCKRRHRHRRRCSKQM